jgi:ribonuclease D
MNIKFRLHLNDLDNQTSSKLMKSTSIAVDSETMGLKVKTDRLCLAQMCMEKDEVHIIQFNKKFNAPNFVSILENSKILKIGQFLRFDLAVFKHYLNASTKNIYDCKIASKICRTSTSNHGLKDLCKDLLGVTISKEQQQSDWGANKLSDVQLKYAATDVIYLHELKTKLDEILKRENKLELAQNCFNFLESRVNLDLAGIDFDIFAHS